MRRSPTRAIMVSSVSKNDRLMLSFRSATGKEFQQRGQATEKAVTKP